MARLNGIFCITIFLNLKFIDGDTTASNSVHLDLLIKYIKEAYESITQRLISLLENGEITYDLL